MQNIISSTPALSAAPFAGAGVRVAQAVKAVLLAPVRFYRARAAFAAVAALDEHQLRDIGLTPGDLHAVDLYPGAEDPTNRLATIVDERHRYRNGFQAR